MDDRACKSCGEMYTPNKSYQKFCQPQCSDTYRRSLKPLAETASPEEIASANLLRALLAYGWRHDGLPGLSPWEFRALAREHGVTG